MPFSLLGRSKERVRSQGSSEEGAPRCMGQPGMSGNLRFPAKGLESSWDPASRERTLAPLCQLSARESLP